MNVSGIYLTIYLEAKPRFTQYFSDNRFSLLLLTVSESVILLELHTHFCALLDKGLEAT